MRRLIVPALLLLSLVACSNDPETLATCKGPVFALNTGHWSPQPADLGKPKVAAANE